MVMHKRFWQQMIVWAFRSKKTKQNKQLNKENKNKNQISTVLGLYIINDMNIDGNESNNE